MIPSDSAIARGRLRRGFFRSPAVNVSTLNPRKAKNVRATLAMIFDAEG